MAGAGRAHNLIVSNLHYLLYPLARKKGCRLYVAHMKLRVGEATFYYPDLMAVCAPPPENPFYEEAPCLVVEVLSPRTEAADRREKLWRYLSLPKGLPPAERRKAPGGALPPGGGGGGPPGPRGGVAHPSLPGRGPFCGSRLRWG